ncbi:DUF6904 family protein [Massilia horti]|uniref:Uncharacterized protein n=1 Tax=Massilia horti TaxID=2562153 RepID=A0A4Y9SR10_9BURK|nr:hypothetical protein [Massilia horti]TFW28905.1 hypothetical protein E4O92_19920 [Massilia horti]
MLAYQLLRNHAGILLCGDYLTLKALHDAVHEVNERSPIIQDKEGSFLALAYDARMAYERKRRVITPPEHTPEIGIRFGVEILWPVLVVQARMLRTSLGYIDSSKQQQAITYALESVIEEAINEDFGEKALSIREQWGRLDPAHPSIEERLDSRGAQFCAWTKAERKAKLAGLLASFDPMYENLYPHWVASGAVDLVAPDELASFSGTEWKDPRW